MNNIINRHENLIKLILTMIIYFIFPSCLLKLYEFYTNSTIDLSNSYNLALFDLIVSTIDTILIIILNLDLFINGIVKIKCDKKNKLLYYIKEVLYFTIIFMVVKIICGILETSLFNIFHIEYQDVDNQVSVENAFTSAPLLMILSGCLIAPICEELVFRGSIKNVIKNKRVFIAVSGLIFGLAHVIQHDLILFSILLFGILLDKILNSNISFKKKIIRAGCALLIIFGICISALISIYGISYLISEIKPYLIIGSLMYIVLGMLLAYIYSYTDIIYENIIVHALNNILSYISILIN